jgi:hypothetical protein
VGWDFISGHTVVVFLFFSFLSDSENNAAEVLFCCWHYFPHTTLGVI